MGNYRIDNLYPAKDNGASGTATIDIDYKKPISRIDITFKVTRGALTLSKAPPAGIPKIELLDGSTPLHSLTGYTNQALAYYNRPGVSMTHGQEINTQSQWETYSIDFGRHLWDPRFAFDPTRFSNPQLKVQYNEALSDASASVSELAVWAYLFDDKAISPEGFLKAREIWSGAFLAENSINKVMLDDDEIIRQILVRANYEGYEPWYQVDIAKLDEVSGGKVLFDYTDLEQYYRRMKSQWPMIVTPLATHAYATASVFFIPQTDYWAGVNLTPVAATAEYYITTASARGGKVSVIGSADTQCIGKAHGWLPWHTFQFPMGVLSDPEDWYDPRGKKPRLQLTSNTAGVSGDGNVVLETVHRY